MPGLGRGAGRHGEGHRPRTLTQADIDALPRSPIPPFPRGIIEELPYLQDYVDDPCPVTAFRVGVTGEYLGHCEERVAYRACTVLHCTLRDLPRGTFTEDQELTLNALMADA